MNVREALPPTDAETRLNHRRCRHLPRLVVGTVLGSIFALGMLAMVPWATAQSVPASLPARVVVGPPPGPYPMARVNGHRNGMVEELPSRLQQTWNSSAPGDVRVPAAVDPTGAVVVATESAWLVQLDSEGRTQWKKRMDTSPASTGPVIMSDGTRFVLSISGHAWGLDPLGHVLFSADLARFGTNPRTHPLPVNDGSIAVAIGTNLLVLDRAGSVIKHADVGQRLIGGLLSDGQSLIATTESGDVIRWSSPLPPQRIGRFRGDLRATAARADDNALLAIVDSTRLVSMDLSTGLTATLLSTTGLEATPAIGHKDRYHVTTEAGVLLNVSSAGLEHRTRLLATRETPSDADQEPAPTRAQVLPSPPVLVDKVGRVAFARSGGLVGVVQPDGQVHSIASACVRPIDIAPAGRGKLIVVCSNGVVFLFGS